VKNSKNHLHQIEITFCPKCRTSKKIKRIITKSARCSFSVIPQKILKNALMNTRKKVTINISVVTKNEMRKLNYKFRHKKSFTDVLSFSRKIAFMDIGDIVISPAVAKLNANKFKTNYYEELSRLTVHGILHLFGFDHEKSKKEAEKMYKFTEKALNCLKKTYDFNTTSSKLSLKEAHSIVL